MVLCFGELLLRIGLDPDGSWLKNNSVPLFMGGAEANVATTLSQWNVPVSYLTVLPDNILGKQLLGNLQEKGIDTGKVLLGGNRVGLYYLSRGQDVKNASVIYDRAYSSFSTLKRGDIDWKEVFKDVSWFHFSAISPALNETLADICLEGLEIAHQSGIYISVDLNYRAALWGCERDPRKTMLPLLQYCDLIMGNLWSIDKMTGLTPGELNNCSYSTDEYVRLSFETGVEMFKAFPQCKAVAKTFRFDGRNSDVSYFSTFTGRSEDTLVSKRYASAIATEKVGSGDCFMAGLIYGVRKKISSHATLEFATAAAFNKLFIYGDTTKQSVEEITDFIYKNAI